MSIESNSPLPDDERLDAEIRQRVGALPDSDLSVRRNAIGSGFAASIRQRDRLRTRRRAIVITATLLVAAVGIWRVPPLLQTADEPNDLTIAGPTAVSRDEDSKSPGALSTVEKNNAAAATVNAATTARLFATPPPVTRLDVIDEDQSALLTGLQSMLEEELE